MARPSPAYQNGKQVVTATDTHYTTGAPGIWMYYAANQITNWSGGDVATAPTYSVGGTVSGLSGTVVLQDNGGDNLTVTAERLLHLPDQLASGAAYAVTVKTQPSGPDLHGRQRHRHQSLGEHHQRRGDLHH